MGVLDLLKKVVVLLLNEFDRLIYLGFDHRFPEQSFLFQSLLPHQEIGDHEVQCNRDTDLVCFVFLQLHLPRWFPLIYFFLCHSNLHSLPEREPGYLFLFLFSHIFGQQRQLFGGHHYLVLLEFFEVVDVDSEIVQ